MSSQYIPNYPAALSMDYFQAITHKFGSLAKSARFIAKIVPVGPEVVDMAISNPAYRDLMYLCEAAEFPGRGFMNVDLRYYGPSLKLPYQSTYEDINLTFLCRNESYERQFFDDWMEIINPTSSFNLNYRDDYRCYVEVYQIADYAEGAYGGSSYYPGFGGLTQPSGPPAANYKFTLLDAWPVLVNPQQITWADDQFLRLGVSFTYHWWTRFSLDGGIEEDFEPISYDII